MKLKQCKPGVRVRVVGKELRRTFPKVRKQTARIKAIEDFDPLHPVKLLFKERIHTATPKGRTIYVAPEEIEAVE